MGMFAQILLKEMGQKIFVIDPKGELKPMDAFEASEDCTHENNETIEVPGTDETVTICHDCGCAI